MIFAPPNVGQPMACGPRESANPHLWTRFLGGIVPWYIGKQCRNPAPNRYPVTGTGTAYNIAGSPYGRCIAFTGNAYQEWANGTANPFKLGSDDEPLTIQAHFKFTHKTSANKMYLFRSDNRTVATNPYGYSLYVEAYENRLVFGTDIGSLVNFSEWKSATNSLTHDKWHHVVVTYWPWDVADPEISQYVVMWIDGVLVFPSVPATEYEFACTTALNTHSRCGASFGATAVDFSIDLLGVWNHRFPWRAIRELCADPLAMFRRRRSGGGKGSRLISIGGTALRRLNVAVAG